MNNSLKEKKLSSELIWSGRIFDVYRDSIELPDGKTTLRDYVLHNGGAAILPIDAENNCYLVRQWRYPQDGEMLEIPAGKLERGEDPLDTAVRELEEECGFLSDCIEYLGCTAPTPAYVHENMHLYIATKLTVTAAHLDEGEFLEVIKLPLKKAADMVMSGELPDAKTQIAVLRAARKLGI